MEVFSSTRGLRYHARASGFFRVNICGWRFVVIDTAKHRACYSDRTHGIRLCRFLFRLSRVLTS